MNLLLDEQMSGRFGRLLSGHEFFTVQQMGWDGKHNGELLALARNRFDAFITLDRNMEYQQNITEADILYSCSSQGIAGSNTWSRWFRKYLMR